MAEEVVFKISAKWDELNKTLTSSSKAIDDWSKKNLGGFSSMAQSLGTLALRFSALAGPVVGAGAAIFAMAQKTANAGDELHDMSKRTGIAVESLSGLKHAAELSGSSLEGVAVGLKFLGRNMAEAKNGTGEAKDAFKALGINVADSTGKLRSTEEVFLQLSDKFNRMEDGAGKTALAMQIFGRSGTDLIPLLNEGGDGIRKMTEEAKKLGLIFTTEGAAAADQFNDNMTKLKGNITGLVYTISNEFIPSLNRLMETGLFGAPVATSSERINGLTKRVDILNDALIRLYDKRKHGGDIEALDKQIKNLWAQKTAIQKEIEKLSGKTPDGKKEPAPAVVDPEKAARERKAYKDELNRKLAADNEYHLKKWQAETEWAAKERALQGKTIAESLADTSKAIDEEIQMQLHLIDVKEKEGAISPIAAIEERIKWEQSLLAIQEDALDNAEAYTLEWYAAADAVAKTREDIVGLTNSKLSVAIDILSSPTKAIEEGIRYLADALSSIPEKLSNTWESLKGLFGGDSKEGAAQEKEIKQNKLWASMGKIGEIILIVKAIANFPKLLADFIKSFMQSLFDFPKYFIELFEGVLAKFPRMIFAVLRNFVNSIPAMITAIVNGIYNSIISIVYGLLSWIPGMKLNTNGDSSGLDENTDAVSELQKSIDSLNDSINKQLTDLLTSSDSPASAIDRLQIAWEEVSKAKGVFAGASDEGKVEAGKSLQDALSSYLDIAQEAYQRPSEEYQAIFDSTVSELKAIQAGLAGIDTTDSGSWYSIEFDSSEFTKIFSEAWEGLKKIFSDAWKGLKKIFSDAWKGLKSIFSDAWEEFKTLPDKLWDKLKELPDLIAKAIKKALGVDDGGEGQGDVENFFHVDIPGVKWHDGGLLKKAHSGMYIGGGLQSYEVPIIAKVGEGILNDYNGMRAIGGEAGLNYANKTGRMMGGGGGNVTYQIAPQVTIHTKGEVDTASLVRQIVRATEDSLKYGKMKQIVNA